MLIRRSIRQFMGCWLLGSNQHSCSCTSIICLLDLYWVGQKVYLGLSIRSYKKIQTNFFGLTNISINGRGGLVEKSCPCVMTPLTAAHQVPLPMGFLRQGYWSGSSFPSPGIFLSQESNPRTHVSYIAGQFLTNKPPRKPVS